MFVTFKVVRNRFELLSLEIVEVLKEVVAADVGKVVEVKVKVVFDAVVGKIVDVAGVLEIMTGDGFVVSLMVSSIGADV